MRINKVILSNIGAYLEDYEIDLSINSPKKNLILFGGKNGAGKTTLLEAIRLALFGPYTYGLRTESDQYISNIKPILNKTAISNGEKSYRIILEIERVENYVRTTYSLKRHWMFENGKIKERFEVIKDGQYLNERETENFQSKLREELPPKLFELCLFDGEEIGRIISDNRLSEYIGNSSRVLFNLNLFENLEEDIAQYRKQTNANGKKSELEEQLEVLETKLNFAKKERDELQSEIASLTQKIEANQMEATELRNDFDIHGGLVKEQRDQLVSKMNELEHKRKANMDQVRSFITNLLPIYLIKDLLIEVQAQMNKEQENESYQFVAKQLKPENLSFLVNQLKELGLPVEANEEAVTSLLANEFLSVLQPEDNKLIHRASFHQRSEVEGLVKTLNQLEVDKYITIFSKNQKMLGEIQQIRKQIEENDRNHDFKEMLDRIQFLNEETEKERVRLESLKEEQKEKGTNISFITADIEKVKAKVTDSNRSESTLGLSIKISEVSQRFRNLQLKKKLQQVEIEAVHMINQLFSKENFIHQIKIDHETFEVMLLSTENEEMDKQKLSAGEKELLLLSIIWAMFKTSGSRIPFIFDTLLGRLDQTHKERLLTHLIPNFGEQVIILSTDSEIDEDHFKLTLPIISKIYTLGYDKVDRKVKIFKDQYFDLKETELGV